MTNLAQSISQLQQQIQAQQANNESEQHNEAKGKDGHQDKANPKLNGTLSFFDSAERVRHEEAKVINADIPAGMS